MAIAVVGAIFTYIEKHLTTTAGEWVSHDLRKMLYFHIQRMSMAFHDHAQTGDLISRVTKDIDSLQAVITSGLLNTLVQALTLFGMIGVMFWMNWRFTLVALSVVPVLFLVVYTFTRKIRKLSRNVRTQEGNIVSLIQEVISSMRVVKAFAREEYEQKRLEERSMETLEAGLKARGAKAILAPVVDIIVAAGTALVLWFGGQLALAGALSAGSLVVFLSYLSKMYKPMQELSKMTDTYAKASASYDRIMELLETKSEVRDDKSASPIGKIRGEIEFDNVTFQYEDAQQILKGVSLRIEPGQTVALVGATGSGKSTLLGLIARFYDPSSGRVLIDGKDLRRVKQRSLRDQISIVPQDTTLFHGPIWENIAYGKPNATRDEIVRAAELANVDEFVDHMPEGYDTLVGERGVTLSGGQRQRIAIARAIIRNTPILLLDEPSSGLDAASEKLVFEALDRLIADKTSIIVAHRLSTIRRADLIVVIGDGEVLESGTHDELLSSGGAYSKLHAIQFAESEHIEAEAAPAALAGGKL
jgi:subfamily B ATP-binding cassette protein MsbA